MIRIVRYALNSLLALVAGCLAVLFLMPRLFGYRPYVVVSASMQQSFPVGSLIYVRDAAPEEIAVGDPITFASGSIVITHRVIAIDSEQRVFTTKGDSNNISEQTPFDSLRGKALDFCLPNVGYFASWFSTPLGKLVVMINILSVMILTMALGEIEKWLLDDDPQPDSQPATVPATDTPSRETAVRSAPPTRFNRRAAQPKSVPRDTAAESQELDRIVGIWKEGETVGKQEKTERVFRPAKIRDSAR